MPVFLLAELKITLKRHWLVRTSILLSALGVFVVGMVAFRGFRRKDEIVQKDREATR